MSELGNQKRVLQRKKNKKKYTHSQKTPQKTENTHTSSHGSPFPLPSCANLDMITSEKSRGGSGFTAEMEDTISVCFCACILLHATVFVCVREREKKDPHTRLSSCTSATQNTQSQQHEIPSRFNMRSCTNGMTRKASIPLSEVKNLL